MKRLLPCLILLCTSCSGTRPVRFGPAKFGFAGVIVRGRILTPTGEVKKGKMALNFESAGIRYRIRFEPGETTIQRIEPDKYRVHPTRGLFGFVDQYLTVEIIDRKFRVPFPRDILRKPPMDVRPTKLAPIGILEVKLLPIKKGRRPKIIVRLDDSIAARRSLVEDMIRKMMDPQVKPRIRSSTVSWTRALEQALVKIQGEEEATLSYKPSK